MDTRLNEQDDRTALGEFATDNRSPGAGMLLRRAAIRATRAPSVHNTQPWRLAIRDAALEVHADPDRRVPIFDPLGRQMMMSCGTAVFNVRVTLAAAGRMALVQRFSDRNRPAFLARIGVESASVVPDPAIAVLEPMIGLRRTNRRPFRDRAVAGPILDELVAAARAEDADLVPAPTQAGRDVVRKLTIAATEQRLTVPAYRAELRAWTAETNLRIAEGPAPGIAESTAPEPWAPGVDPVLNQVLAPARWGPEACLVLTTIGDHSHDWVRAGEALERVLLTATQHGLVVGLEASAIEVIEMRTALRHELGLVAHPQLILRVGYADPTPPTRRRLLVDVFTDELR